MVKKKMHTNGSRRVSAWVYTVINPIVDSLALEINFLNSKDITWRNHNKKCEFIHSIEKYVNFTYKDIYKEFIAECPGIEDVKGYVDKHNELLEKVEQSAENVFSALKSNSDFANDIKTLLEGYQSSFDGGGLAKVCGIPPLQIEEHLPFFIEYVINNREQLPSHYTSANFWNYVIARKGKGNGIGYHIIQFANELLSEPMRRITNMKESILECSKELNDKLDNLRRELCEKHDIPPNPVPYLMSGLGLSHEGSQF